MKHTLSSLLVFFTLTAHAQQPAYRDFDVQQPAEPSGGLKALNQFMAVNVRKPFMAQVANIKGLVILQGVAEPNGRIAEVTVARSLRPDCDREAVRAFSLFNAWKPAQKDGKAVRQVVTYPVQFRANELVQYENGLATRYYNNAFQLVASPDSAVLRSEMPTDTFGLPTGNLIFFKRNGKKWKKEVEMTYFRNPILGQKINEESRFEIGHNDINLKPFGFNYIVDNQHTVYHESHFDLDRKLILFIRRHTNQLVTHREETGPEQIIRTDWYGNGQIKQVTAHQKPQAGQPYSQSQQMLAYWDSTGIQLVNEGNGQFAATERVLSMADTNRHTTLTEQGKYEKGLKQGYWTGKRADGSYWYDEQYENGTLKIGRTIYAGQPDTLQYTVAEQQPEFPGGMRRLSQFLAQNIRYPIEAHKVRAQGRVFVSFVVCQDGSLCDFTVLKGAHPALDKEALRVVQLMNGWKPGIQRGRPVRVKYNLPINFNLN